MKWMRAKLGSTKRVLIAASVVALAGVAGFWFWGGGASAAEYMTSKVERGNLRNTVTATGTLQAVTTVEVGSQASGTVSALYADFNSEVRKGQIVAQLDLAGAGSAGAGKSRTGAGSAGRGRATTREG